MGVFVVDSTTEPGILRLRLEGVFTVSELRAFVDAHNSAIDRFESREYRVFVDIRDMKPLSPACAELFEQAKRYSAAHDNFMGSAVWISSAVVAMQHRRTSIDGGVMSTELISHDEAELRAHLAKVHRRS